MSWTSGKGGEEEEGGGIEKHKQNIRSRGG